ncbi:MAG: ATP-binding protein [Oscillospiraceae bacterium]|nr:ATP-binding protein [Oscillospiraceae bacterium]
MVYKLFYRRGAAHILIETAIISVLLVMLTRLVKCYHNEPVGIHFPAAVIVIIALLVLMWAGAGIFSESKQDKKQLSPFSIKQAVDDLPMGLCFADTFGRIVLCNCKMSDIGIMLLGSHPQTLNELESALLNPPETSGIEIIKGSDNLFRFPDGRIRRFHKYMLTAPEIKGYTQLSAQDVTDVYNENVSLERENQKLREINKKLNRMYECMEDTVREKESLDLKVYIHDTLGRSLITIQDIISSSSDSVGTKLESLKEAVSYLSSNRSTFRNTFEDVQQKAAEMGVKVTLDGYIPTDTPAENLIVAAARECVTNCIRHAKGDLVKVSVHEISGIIRVVITNNGEAPHEKPEEGSGLSSLRRSVEASGGEMHISHIPAFALILNIPGKELYEL